jgi:hypothetical protein
MSKLYTIDKPYIAGELVAAGELGGRWRAGWPLASWVVAGELGGHWLAMWSLASCVAGGKLFGSVVFGRCFGRRQRRRVLA